MELLFLASTFWGYFIVVGVVSIIMLIVFFIRKKTGIGMFTKEEEKKMKSNLDLLIKEEEKDENHNYEDDV